MNLSRFFVHAALASIAITGVAAAQTGSAVPVPEMIELPGGTYMMGSAAGEPDEKPLREVTVKPFAIGKYEVTVGEFAAFADETALDQMMGCRYYDGFERLDDDGRGWFWTGFRQTDRHPVVCVSWDEARQYAAWLSKKTGLDFRLPTEEEWEYAAKGGGAADFPWKDLAESCKFTNASDQTRIAAVKAGKFGVSREVPGAFDGGPCADGFVYSAPVGSFPANGFGLYDTLGNAWEMTVGCAEFAKLDDGSPSNFCLRRAPRGGSWLLGPSAARSANRSSIQHDQRNFTIGFRIARSSPAKP